MFIDGLAVVVREKYMRWVCGVVRFCRHRLMKPNHMMPKHAAPGLLHNIRKGLCLFAFKRAPRMLLKSSKQHVVLGGEVVKSSGFLHARSLSDISCRHISMTTLEN